MTEAAPPPRPRRPSPRKHEAILAAAVDCFTESGYAATSMDAIAEAAGVSKQTVYHHFGNKNALFEAVVARVSQTLRRPLVDGDVRHRGPAETLTVFGRHMLDFVLNRQSMAFLRLLIAEVPKFAGVADMLIRLGVEPTTQAMADYLAEETKAGRLAVPDPRRAAMLFFGMLAGDYRFRALLGALPDLDDAELDAHVEAAVKVFLAAYGRAAD